jgi:hypothetical protein
MPEERPTYEVSKPQQQEAGTTPLDRQQEEATEQPLTMNMPADIQLGTITADVYRHLTKIAQLLDLLRRIYPDLNADFGPKLDEWINELDRDVQQWFGFSILESE